LTTSAVVRTPFRTSLRILPWWHTPLILKLPDWLNSMTLPSVGIIPSVCSATSYITFGVIGIACANTHGADSP